MPGGNKSGPEGDGAMTGRGAGFCAGFSVPGFMNRIRGLRVFGRGPGRGIMAGRGSYRVGRSAGWRSRAFYQDGDMNDAAPEQEMDLLIDQSRSLKERIDGVNSRIKELEKMIAKKENK